MNQNLINHPMPIISVNKDGIVTAKNNSMQAAFGVVHVGALANKYTDIDFSYEKFSSGWFCNVECYYCTIFDNDETLLILALDTVSAKSLPFNIISMYKEKIKEVCELPKTDNKTRDRKYVNSINSNLIKANYFNVYKEIFDNRLKRHNDESVVLSKVCTAVKTVTANNFEDASINFEIDYCSGNMVAKISEQAILGIILNTLSFCIINAASPVSIALDGTIGFAKLEFKFKSKSSFDKWLNPDSNALLNSSLSLLIATEIAKSFGYEFSVTKTSGKTANEYSFAYKIPVEVNSNLNFSSEDSASFIAKRLFSLIFFDSMS